MVEIEKTFLPAVSLGTSPFLGAGQFGRRGQDYYRNFYLQPENMISSIIKAYLAPINSLGLFMGPTPRKAIEMMEQTDKVIIAKKVLAAGKLPPEEGIVYVSRIRHIRGLSLGIASEREAEETLNIALKHYD